MHLKDITSLSPDLAADFFGGSREIATKDAEGAALHGAQGSDKGKQRGFSGTRRAGEEDDLPRANLKVHIAQHGAAGGAFPEGELKVAGDHDRFHGSGSKDIGGIGGLETAHGEQGGTKAHRQGEEKDDGEPARAQVHRQEGDLADEMI